VEFFVRGLDVMNPDQARVEGNCDWGASGGVWTAGGKLALDAVALSDPNLHKGRTGLEQRGFKVSRLQSFKEPRPCTNLAGKLESRARRFRVKKLFLVLVAAVGSCASGFAEDHAAPPTRVVVLGTGNPSADPERWGPAW